MSVISGEFSWCKIGKPDVYKGKEKWKIDIKCGKEDTAKLKEEGKKEKTENRGKDIVSNVFTFTRPTTWPKGDARAQPKVLDKHGNSIDPSTVGNGSKGMLQYKTVEGVYDGDPYKIFDLCSIKVTDLVVYGGEDGDEFTFEGDGGELVGKEKEDKEEEDNPF